MKNRWRKYFNDLNFMGQRQAEVSYFGKGEVQIEERREGNCIHGQEMLKTLKKIKWDIC